MFVGAVSGLLKEGVVFSAPWQQVGTPQQLFEHSPGAQASSVLSEVNVAVGRA